MFPTSPPEVTHSNDFLTLPENATPAYAEETIKETLAFTSPPPERCKHL